MQKVAIAGGDTEASLAGSQARREGGKCVDEHKVRAWVPIEGKARERVRVSQLK